jgi:sigma-54 dependent transcriptional regulator, acetoin dehydrogenase operon transcriptional activator AcoR
MSSLQAQHRLERIAQARRAVMQGEHPSATQYVQPWITQSWQRCLQAGHRPDERLSFDPVGAALQQRNLEANRTLRTAARSTLEQLSIAIAQTQRSTGRFDYPPGGRFV